MANTAPQPTAADHEAYGSVTWLCALENAQENWTDYTGHEPSTDAEEAEVKEWARGYITDGMTQVYEGDHLDLIAGTAAEATEGQIRVIEQTHGWDDCIKHTAADGYRHCHCGTEIAALRAGGQRTCRYCA